MEEIDPAGAISFFATFFFATIFLRFYPSNLRNKDSSFETRAAWVCGKEALIMESLTEEEVAEDCQKVLQGFLKEDIPLPSKAIRMRPRRNKGFEYPWRSTIKANKKQPEAEEDYDEDSDDSCDDPDFELTDSDMQSSDECDYNYQSEENEYVSDSSDQSTEIPTVESLPALQVGEVSSSESQRHSVSNIQVQCSKNTKDKRVWDKVHFCYYCKSSFTNITKHYFGPHKNESEVKMILNHPKKSKERNLGLLKLRNAGDFQNNMKVLKEGRGILITWARSNEHTTYKDYLPCENCQAFFLKSNLWRHRQTCPCRKTISKNQKVQSRAQLLLPTSAEVSSALKQKVISKMIYDEVSIAVRNDLMIVSVGEKLFHKHGHLPHLHTFVSQKMRELGRFLIKMREIDTDIRSLTCAITPEKYPIAVKATRLLCKYNEDTNKYSNPSLALKLGHLLKKCANIQKASALIEGDSEKGRKADQFHSLVETEWNDDISSSALQTLTSKKVNKGEILPLSEDIMKLQKYLDDKMKNITDKLETTFSKTGWDELNQITLAKVVLFNRRRGGETERVTLKAYEERLNKSVTVSDVEQTLSPVEKMLCATFERIEIRGKKGRTVPVLLTPQIQKCINLLVKWRMEANVDSRNPYLFPRPNSNSFHALRTTDVLRKYARLAKLIAPHSLTSTRLRKHVATVSQILNLTKNDLEVMANFMGHDIEIHRSFYRIPQETLQVAKMGKLLSAFDSGTISKFKGKKLDDISLDEELSSDEVSEQSSDENNDELCQVVQHKNKTTYMNKSSKCGTARNKRIRSELSSDKESDQSCNENDDEPCQVVQEKKKTCTRSQEIKCGKTQHLSEEQSSTLRKLFHANIIMRRELKKHECVNAIMSNDCLANFDWKKVKNTIHNWITTEKRKIKHWVVDSRK